MVFATKRVHCLFALCSCICIGPGFTWRILLILTIVFNIPLVFSHQTTAMANESLTKKRNPARMNLVLKIPRTGSRPTSPPGNAYGSEFDISLMPKDQIFKRTLFPWSVHKSLTTNNWIATISRPDNLSEKTDKARFQQFCFPTEKGAKKFCKSYAPPKMCDLDYCLICQSPGRARSCRNCGASVCENCSLRWGSHMCPKTYNALQTVTIRVCKSCDWLSNAFCLALLKGRYQDAIDIHATGNVNLRTSFADIRREAMFPIHCAVMGGSIKLVRWLVEVHDCPISVNVDSLGRPLSVQTSASRTLLDLAMTGRSKTDILTYLIQRGLSVDDVKDKTLPAKCLHSILQLGLETLSTTHPENTNFVEDDEHDASVTTLDDPCALCCERSMDCVLSPCGHQLCCSECAKQLEECPVCKAPCQILRVYRS